MSEHVDGLDGVLHAIAYANPEEALGGNFLHTRWPDVATAIQVSTYSLKAITMAALPLMRGGGSPWSASTSTPAGRGRGTTGWAWPRPGSSHCAGTWPETWEKGIG